MAVAEMLDSDIEKMVALLHAVIEDTEITLYDLKQEGFSEEIITAVNVLTKRKEIDYHHYIQVVKKNPIKLKVKIVDMTHNSDLRRMPSPIGKNLQRIMQYKEKIQDLRRYQVEDC